MRRLLLLIGLGIGLGGVLFWIGEAPPAPAVTTTEPALPTEGAPTAAAATEVAPPDGPPTEVTTEAPPEPQPPLPPPPEPDPDATKGRCGALDDILTAKYGAAFSAEAGRLAMEKFPLEQVMDMCEAWAALPPAELEAKLATDLGLKPTK